MSWTTFSLARKRGDMAKRLIDFDQFSGIETWHEYDAVENKTVITETQDVEALLKQNRAEYNDADMKRRGMENEMLKVASVPLTVLMEWKTKHGVDAWNKDHTKKIMKLLNDPEYRYLRTASGRY